MLNQALLNDSNIIKKLLKSNVNLRTLRVQFYFTGIFFVNNFHYAYQYQVSSGAIG